LSGVRFSQRRWQEAASLARDALALDPHDAYALDVLGSSLFMENDALGALRAWNQIGKPRVNLVRIEGVRRTRHQAIVEALGIRPNMLLHADAFERARRRLDDLPDHSTTRLAVRPEADGFATVDVVVAERETVPRGAVEWTGAAVSAAVNREVAVAIPGSGGQGQVWSARWSWWSGRPGVSASFSAPRMRSLPGIWRVEGSWQAETYGPRDVAAPTPLRQSRTRGVLSVSDWLNGALRYELLAGLDGFDGARKTAATGAQLERRAFGDHVSIAGTATRWTPVGGGSGFSSAAAHIAMQSTPDRRGWMYYGVLAAAGVSADAPLALWPGAGDGHARPALLRAHPLVKDGVMATDDSSVFGRTLVNATAEMQRGLARPMVPRMAIAVFVDAARASRRAVSGGEAVQVDAGTGLRVKIPGSAGLLRVDVAHGLRDGANALSVGWLLTPFAR
jgi:hypothetical protein